MLLYKLKFTTLFHKTKILDIFIINFISKFKVNLSFSKSNRFVNLKSPFHYKLTKNHFSVKQINIIFFLPTVIGCKTNNFYFFGNLFFKKKYNFNYLTNNFITKINKKILLNCAKFIFKKS